MERFTGLRTSGGWLAFVVMFCLVFSVTVVIARRRHAGRQAGRFCDAGCANPSHGILKSRDSSGLRAVSKPILDALRGKTSRRRKICVDCIAKLSRKPQYSHLFKTVGICG